MSRRRRQIDADDAFLDALGSGQEGPWMDGDDLAHGLAALRADVDSEPIPPMGDGNG